MDLATFGAGGFWEHNPVFAQVARLSVTLFFAWITVAAIRNAVGRLTRHDGQISSEQAWVIVRDALKDGTQVVVLRILLPATAVVALAQGNVGGAKFVWLFWLGFILAVAMLLVFRLIYQATGQRDARWKAGAAGSMGGRQSRACGIASFC